MTDAPPTTGLHHVTNICTDMDETVAFYEDALGWYTVKRTQNYDDPGTPHYYFSSTPTGEPGTTVTYFEYPGSQGGAGRGRAITSRSASKTRRRSASGETTSASRGARLRGERPHLLQEHLLQRPRRARLRAGDGGPGFTRDEEEPGSEEIDPFEEGYEK